MKKLFLLFIALCALTVAQAQVVSSYTMQATQGTYTEITEGTTMDLTGLDLTVEDPLTGVAWYPHGIVTESTTAAGFPIGFDFTFNDMACNQFIIGANGYIALGKDEITNDPSHKQHIVSREEGADNTMGILPNNFSSGIWVNDSSEFSYKVVGEAPNRTLVVQFKNWAPNFGYDAETVASMNMQLRLNETSNTIEFVLGDLVYDGDFDRMTRFALRGYYQDILCLKETNDEDVDPETVDMIDWVAVPEDYQVSLGAGMVTSGLTYTFTPPADCVMPSSHFNYKTFEAKTNSFTITWDWADFSDADHVLLMLSENGVASPVDGVYYAEGDSLGNALVLAYTTDTIYELPEDIQLEPKTRYHLQIHVANSFCSNGPVYDVGGVLPFDTKPSMPESIEITNTTTNTLTFNVEANDVDDVFVILTDSVRPNPPYVNVIEFGKPMGVYNLGDLVEGVGRVVYIGPSAENVVVEGLEEGTTYYLRAHSFNYNFGYSSEVIETSDVTIATLPWKLDLSNTNKQEIPVGWTSVSSNKQLVATAQKSGYGEESLQFSVQIQPNTTNGHTTELTSPYIIIDKENALFSFEYNMNTPGNWGMAGTKYDEWNEKDTFAIQVSRNGGVFETVTLVNSTNNIKVDTITQFVPVTADLSDYLNDTIQVRLYWSCYSNGKVRLTLEKWNIEEYIAPVTPEVKVENITHLSAKVTWRSEQENYELTYAKAGEEFDTTIVVEGAMEFVLTELEAETEYQVKVRGIIAEEEYSAWSEVVTFTTAAWPECDAPTNLAATVDGQTATLTWEGTEDHLTWDVRYRDANSTTWITIEGLEEPTTVLEDLEKGVTYLWNVRAYCTAERVTSWSAQATFTTGPTVPVAPVVTGSFEGDIISLVWEPVPGATAYNLYYGGKLLSGPFEETIAEIQVPSVGTYCFTVTASNEVGESAHSDEVCVTVTLPEGMEVPAAPELVATLDNNFVVLTWEEVEGATYYDVYIDVPQGEDQYLGTATMEDLPIRMQLPEYGEYCFYVIAANLAGESEQSNVACVNYGNVGVEENEFTFNIYPNPVNDKLVIETEAEINEVVVYTITGVVVSQQSTVNSQQSYIDVTNLNSGVYFVKVVTDNGEVVKSFVKK